MEELLALAGQSAADSCGLAEKRLRFLKRLATLLKADRGHWAWGRGHPARGPVVPAAIIDFGYSPQQQAALIEAGLSVEFDRSLRGAIAPTLKVQATHTRRQLYSDTEWRGMAMRKLLLPCGEDEWVHSVRYCAEDTWTNLWLARIPGKPPFSPRDGTAIDLLMQHLPLLHSDDVNERSFGGDGLSGLTPKQRSVLLLLLSGQSRKLIADVMRISEHTVNEHVKALFKHFNVRSAPELAGLFLRAQ